MSRSKEGQLDSKNSEGEVIAITDQNSKTENLYNQNKKPLASCPNKYKNELTPTQNKNELLDQIKTTNEFYSRTSKTLKGKDSNNPKDCNNNFTTEEILVIINESFQNVIHSPLNDEQKTDNFPVKIKSKSFLKENHIAKENDLKNIKDIININTAKKHLYRMKLTNSKEKIKGLITKSSISDFGTEDIITVRKIKVNYITNKYNLYFSRNMSLKQTQSYKWIKH